MVLTLDVQIDLYNRIPNAKQASLRPAAKNSREKPIRFIPGMSKVKETSLKKKKG